MALAPGLSEQQMLCLLAGGRSNAQAAMVELHSYGRHTEDASSTQTLTCTRTNICDHPTCPHPPQRIHPPAHLWVGTRFASIGYAEPVDDTGKRGADGGPTQYS